MSYFQVSSPHIIAICQLMFTKRHKTSLAITMGSKPSRIMKELLICVLIKTSLATRLALPVCYNLFTALSFFNLMVAFIVIYVLLEASESLAIEYQEVL